MPIIGFHLLFDLCKTINTLLLYMWWEQSTEWFYSWRNWEAGRWTLLRLLEGQSLLITHFGLGTPSLLFLLVKFKNTWTNRHTLPLVWGSERLRVLVTTLITDNAVILTFQSSDVTSLLLGTSCPPSRIQCLSTNCVEPLVLFSLRFHILAVESPDL